MNRLPTAALASLVATAGLSCADPVDDNLVTTFQAGQPACAADVNQTIQALIAAVNDNAARVAQLEAQVASLLNPVASLSDRILACEFQMFAREHRAGGLVDTTDTPLENKRETWGLFNESRFASTGTLDLKPDGTFVFQSQEEEFERLVTTYLVDEIDIVAPTGPTRMLNVDLLFPLEASDSGTDSGTWSLAGQLLTLTFPAEGGDPAESETLFVSADGGMLMAAAAEGGLPGPGTATSRREFLALGLCIAKPRLQIELLDESGNPTVVLSHPDRVTTNPGQTRQFRVSNIGLAPLRGLALSSSGPTAPITVPLGVTELPPSSSAVFSARRLSGNGQPWVELASDDPDSPVCRILLD